MRLLDHLLVAALHAAVADADRPHRAVVVGDQLHLDVAGVGDDALHEHGRVAERLGALGAGALERLGELLGAVDAADAAAAAAGRRLDHQRVADALGVFERGRRPCRPRRRSTAATGTSACSASSLAPILSPSDRITSGRGPMNTMPRRVAQLGELGALGDESPPDPRRVGAGRGQRLARARRGRGTGCRSRRAVGRRRGRPPRRPPATNIAARSARVCRAIVRRSGDPSGFVAQLADRVDEAHRRLAAVDDGDPVQGAFHRPDCMHAPRVVRVGQQPVLRLTTTRGSKRSGGSERPGPRPQSSQSAYEHRPVGDAGHHLVGRRVERAVDGDFEARLNRRGRVAQRLPLGPQARPSRRSPRTRWRPARPVVGRRRGDADLERPGRLEEVDAVDRRRCRGWPGAPWPTGGNSTRRRGADRCRASAASADARRRCRRPARPAGLDLVDRDEPVGAGRVELGECADATCRSPTQRVADHRAGRRRRRGAAQQRDVERHEVGVGRPGRPANWASARSVFSSAAAAARPSSRSAIRETSVVEVAADQRGRRMTGDSKRSVPRTAADAVSSLDRP